MPGTSRLDVGDRDETAGMTPRSVSRAAVEAAPPLPPVLRPPALPHGRVAACSVGEEAEEGSSWILGSPGGSLNASPAGEPAQWLVGCCDCCCSTSPEGR